MKSQINFLQRTQECKDSIGNAILNVPVDLSVLHVVKIEEGNPRQNIWQTSDEIDCQLPALCLFIWIAYPGILKNKIEKYGYYIWTEEKLE